MVFNLKGFKPVFTYGDTLYNPTRGQISQDLVAHEEVHERQQKLPGVKAWWNKYLVDEEFRLSQEIEAYRAQYAFIKTQLNRKARMPLLKELATNLSSSLYGNLININEAKDIINAT